QLKAWALLFADFVCDDDEAFQRGGTERCRYRDIGRIAAAGDEDPAVTPVIVTCIERVPATVKKDLGPRGEIHWCGIPRNPDSAEITSAVSRGDIHAAAKRDRQVREVAANADPFLMPLGCGSVAAGVVVPEFDAIMDVVADRLNPLPTAGNSAEHP